MDTPVFGTQVVEPMPGFENADVLIQAGPKCFHHKPGESPAEVVQAVETPVIPPPPSPTLRSTLSGVNLKPDGIKFALGGYTNDKSICEEACKAYSERKKERLQTPFALVREKILRGEIFQKMKNFEAEIEKRTKKKDAEYAAANDFAGPKLQAEKDMGNFGYLLGKASGHRSQAHEQEEVLAKLEKMLKDAEKAAVEQLTKALEETRLQQIALTAASQKKLFDELMGPPGTRGIVLLVALIQAEQHAIMELTNPQVIMDKFGKLPATAG